jgi:hypothetical protein
MKMLCTICGSLINEPCPGLENCILNPKLDTQDFGFSFEEDESFDDLNNSLLEIEKEKEELANRLESLYTTICKFLDNLAKNPEKQTIKWPDRADKIEKFKEHLRNIKEGNY